MRAGVSINDLRKNLNDLNEQMDRECRSSTARYGVTLDASLITGIDPPADIESALAAINTAHNEVSAHRAIETSRGDRDEPCSSRSPAASLDGPTVSRTETERRTGTASLYTQRPTGSVLKGQAGDTQRKEVEHGFYHRLGLYIRILLDCASAFPGRAGCD